MINQHNNILKDPKIKRLVSYSEDNQQIDILDQRFYQRNKKYYPSVTSILDYFPKNKFFLNWLKEVGFNSENIVQKAAYEGDQVHNAVHDYVNGIPIHWLDDTGKAQYSLTVWKMIHRFVDFWTTYKPKLIASEYHLFSDDYEFAGTTDLVIELNDKVWMLDVKTSNNLYEIYNLQTSAYSHAWNETHDTPIEESGILWLKASTRGPQKNKIQGKGWQLKSCGSIDENFDMFLKIRDIYKFMNPDDAPHTESYPTVLKLEE